MRYLFTADIHLRTTRPVCRTDDWDEFQTNRFRAIYDTARLHKCNAVVIVGDLFDNPNPSEKLLHLVLTTITSYGIMTVVMVGNHDVPYHALQHLADTKIALLGYHPLVKFLTPEPGHGIDFVSSYDGVRLIHELTFERDEDIPATVKAHTADDWLKEFPDDDLIVCGDMHRPFSKTVDERTVINCGHIACQKVSERYKSGVWVVDDYEGKIEYIEFPSDLEFVSTDHIDEKIEKDNRFSNLVSVLDNKNQEVTGLDFLSKVKEKCDALDNGKEIYSLVLDTLEERN